MDHSWNEPGHTDRAHPAPAALGAGAAYEFAGLRFDPVRGLEREGRWLALAPLERRALEALLAAAGSVISKDALALAVWCHRSVSDESITRVVYRLRQALRAAGAPGALVTVYRRGFRIGVPVATIAPMAGIVHPVALENVVTARELLGGRGARDLAVATVAVRRALRLDPRSAEAWQLLAWISLQRVLRGRMPRELGLRRLRFAATRAHVLAPRSGSGLAFLGWLDAAHAGDMAAVALLDEAVATDPHDAIARGLRAWGLLVVGRREEALRAFAVARELDPLARTWTAVYSYALACSGRSGEALALLNSAIRRAPDADALFAARSTVAAIAAELDLALADALRAMALAPDVATHRVALACAHAARKDHEAARRAFAAAAESRFGVTPTGSALFYAVLGEDAAAAAAWTRAQEERCLHRGLVQHDPRLRVLALDPGQARPATALRSPVAVAPWDRPHDGYRPSRHAHRSGAGEHTGDVAPGAGKRAAAAGEPLRTLEDRRPARPPEVAATHSDARRPRAPTAEQAPAARRVPRA